MAKRTKPKLVTHRNEQQKDFLQALNSKSIIICDAAFATGKSYIAIGWAVENLLADKYERIVITSALSNLNKIMGHAPGTLEEKTIAFMAPQAQYVRAFAGSPQAFNKLTREGQVYFVPISLTRGHSFSNSIIIVDESQLFSKNEFFMLLTRMDKNSKLILIGDRTQCDTPNNNFFAKLVDNLEDDDVAKVTMTEQLRHPTMVRVYNKTKDY